MVTVVRKLIGAKKMRERRIEAMYALFGKGTGICKDCKYFRGSVGSYKKCRVYGISSSEATDWRMKWPACGLKDKEYTGDTPIIEVLKHSKRYLEEQQCDGQMEMNLK